MYVCMYVYVYVYICMSSAVPMLCVLIISQLNDSPIAMVDHKKIMHTVVCLVYPHLSNLETISFARIEPLKLLGLASSSPF